MERRADLKKLTSAQIPGIPGTASIAAGLDKLKATHSTVAGAGSRNRARKRKRLGAYCSYAANLTRRTFATGSARTKLTRREKSLSAKPSLRPGRLLNERD